MPTHYESWLTPGTAACGASLSPPKLDKANEPTAGPWYTGNLELVDCKLCLKALRKKGMQL